MGIVYYYEFKNRSDLFENVKYLVYVAYFVCVPDPPPATTHLHQRQWSVPRGAPRIPSVLRRSRMLRVFTDWALDPPRLGARVVAHVVRSGVLRVRRRTGMQCSRTCLCGEPVSTRSKCSESGWRVPSAIELSDGATQHTMT